MDFPKAHLAVDVERRDGVELLQTAQLGLLVAQFLIHFGQPLQRRKVEVGGFGRRFIGHARFFIILHGTLGITDNQVGRGAAGLERQDLLAGGQSLGVFLVGQKRLGQINGLAEFALRLEGEGHFFDQRIHGHRFGDEVVRAHFVQKHEPVALHVCGQDDDPQLAVGLLDLVDQKTEILAAHDPLQKQHRGRVLGGHFAQHAQQLMRVGQGREHVGGGESQLLGQCQAQLGGESLVVAEYDDVAVFLVHIVDDSIFI